MGLTRFSGPVYGAKATLWSYGPVTLTTNASSQLETSITVPAGEDWMVTDVWCNCSTCSSAGNRFSIKSEGGSTVGIVRIQGMLPSTVAQTVYTVDAGTSTTLHDYQSITPTAGHFEGLYVPAGSTLRFASTGVNPQAKVNFKVNGYIRFVSSTRAEGI